MKAVLLALLIAYIAAYQCYAEGDPHIKNFFGQRYNFQGIGDYFVLKTKNVQIVGRQRSWGNTASVMTSVALRIRGNRFIVDDAKFLTFKANGRTVSTPAQGKSKTFRNVNVFKISSGRLRFVTKNFQIDVQGYDQGNNKGWPQKQYFNVIIDSPKRSAKWSGYCMSSNGGVKATGYFENTFHRRHFGKRRKICTRRRLIKSIRHCRRYKFKSSVHFKNCVFDRCHKLSARNTRRFYKLSKRHKKISNRRLRKNIRRERRHKRLRNVRGLKRARRHRRRVIRRRRTLRRRRTIRRRRANRRRTIRRRRVARRNRRRVIRRRRTLRRRRTIRRRRANRRRRVVRRRRCRTVLKFVRSRRFPKGAYRRVRVCRRRRHRRSCRRSRK